MQNMTLTIVIGQSEVLHVSLLHRLHHISSMKPQKMSISWGMRIKLSLSVDAMTTGGSPGGHG